MWPTTRPSISITLFVVELSLLSRAHRRSKLVRSSNSAEVNAAIRIASRSLECSKSTPRSRSSIPRRTSCPEPSRTAVNATCRNSGDIADHSHMRAWPPLRVDCVAMASWYDAWADRYAESSNADTADVPFYVGLALEADGPLVELAVGTGRVAIPV